MTLNRLIRRAIPKLAEMDRQESICRKAHKPTAWVQKARSNAIHDAMRGRT